MILSVGASAQITVGPVVYHRFPEVKFTAEISGYDGVEFTIEAWDWQFGGANQGYLRGQKIALTDAAKNEYTGRLVSRMPLFDNKSQARWNITNNVWITYKNQRMLVSDFTYDKVIPDGYEGREDELEEGECLMDLYRKEHGIGPNNEEIFGTASYSTFPVIRAAATTESQMPSDNIITGNYTVPKYYEHEKMGKVNVIEIGPFAFRNASWNDERPDWFKPTTITVPKEIQTIGRGGLSVNILDKYVKKITFEAGSPISVIPDEAFMSCQGLEEINIPAGVISIGGAALGGCKKLKKIIFEGATPPFLGTLNGKNFVTSTGSTPNMGQASGSLAPDCAKCIIEVPLGSALSYTQKNDLYKNFPMSSKFTMNKQSITYCSDLPFTFKQYDTSDKSWSNGSVTVYYVEPRGVKVFEGKIDVTEIAETKKIPTEADNTDTGHFGVILSGEAGQTTNIFYPNNVISDVFQVADNCLEGVLEKTPIDINPQYLYYVLTNGKFLRVKESGELNANRAFIMIEVPEGFDVNEARDLTISLPDETTGITTHEVQGEQNDAWYTLQGVQVNKPQKGIFIKNGKKYIIK